MRLFFYCPDLTNMLKILELNIDLEGIGKKDTVCVLARKGNRIYKKHILDKRYKLWKKFKNATRAKKFIRKIELEYGIEYFGTPNNIYLSSRLI